jgi:tRNA threonylcarbamoyladenosine biosynthesis protein TsaB
MKIIAFETALRNCSVALGIDGNQVGYAQAKELSQQSEELFSLSQNVLADFNFTFQNLDGIAVNVGPGGFTGVRIGVAAAKAMKLVLPNLKLIGITSLELLAKKVQNESRTIITVLPSGLQEYYVQVFTHDLYPVSEISCINFYQLQQLYTLHPNSLVVTNAELSWDVPYHQSNIDASVVLARVYEKLNIASNGDYNNLKPVYVKSPNITIPQR